MHSTNSKSEVVRIGYQKAGTLNLLRLRGQLEPDMQQMGLRVEWIGFPAGPQLLEALNAGAIDFGHVGDAPPILAQAAGVSFVYTACEPARAHAEAIIVPVNSPLTSVSDLAGKRVALNKGSNVHFLLVRALEAADVPYDKVEKVYLTPSDSRAAFEGGSVDAWAAWDPYLAEAELSSGARVLADGEGLVANREIHLASRRLVDERPEAVQAIVAALDREGTWARANVDEAATMLAAELSLRFEVMRRVIGRKGYGVTLIGDEVLSEQQQVADTFFEIGLIPSPIDVREARLPNSFTVDATQPIEVVEPSDNTDE
ncbi:MAG: aliphatic sulfonate ABC transporter substrate-binding protein [Pirellulales bacterium]|nr:aliphatic sulfonate ABC transporter substrate-binding protein [Pirellulales bacterium]